LGEVVREKMAKLKEAGMESDLEPALPPISPLCERQIFIIGNDTPDRTPEKNTGSSPFETPGQTPVKDPQSSPLERKD